MDEKIETNYLVAKRLKKYAVLKKWHWKLIPDDEVMLNKKNVEDVPNSDVADINLTN